MPTELREGVWWLDLGGVNAYLVDDEGALTLVDAGAPWGERALDSVVEAGFELDELERVLVTHYDVDHVADLSRVDERVTVYAGEEDAPLVAGERRPNPLSRKGAFQLLTSPLLGDPPGDVHRLADGDTVGSFTVYETPGHTPGHVAYVSESLDAAFLGDMVRESDGRLELTPWFITADTDQAARSVRSLAERAPPFAVAGVGHGTPFERDGKRHLAELAERP